MADVTMPTRLETLKRTARKLLPGWDDVDMAIAAWGAIVALVYSVSVLLVRLVILLTLPISALLLYPITRANTRRWFKWAQEQERERAALITTLEQANQTPIEWPHDWAKPIPAEDLRRAADEQERTKGPNGPTEAETSATASVAGSDAESVRPVEVQRRKATDEEIAEWVRRHDMEASLKLGSADARAAFEDAESLHLTYGVDSPDGAQR